MQSPLVSIIVPIYKVEPYLRRCLDSIVNQTYTNLEIILVDDGSPDACPQICDEYAAKDNRIVVIHKENGGLSDARNAGLDICKGEYISFVDSDDWIDEKYIEILINPFFEDEYDFVIADYKQTNESLNSSHILCQVGPINENSKIISTYCRLQYPPCAWAKLYKVSFIKENNFKFYKDLLFEDQIWSCEQAVAAKKIHVLSDKIYHYTFRSDSIMHSQTNFFEKQLNSWSIILSSEVQIFNTYLATLQNETNFFFLQKISEVLNSAPKEKKSFKTAFFAIKKAFNKNPIFFWFKQAKGTKKVFFFLLYMMPSLVSEKILYHIFNKK